MALDYNTIQLSGTGSIVTEELTNGATLTITKTGGVQDITGSLTPHGTQTLLLFEVVDGLSNQVPGLNKSDFSLVDAGGVKLNTVYSTTNFGFLLPKGTYNSGTFTIATDLPTIPPNTLRIRAIGVKRSGTNMVELDGAGAPIYNNQYSFEFNGVDSRFPLNNDPAFNLIDSFTISAWIKPETKDPPDDGAIIDKSTGTIGSSGGQGWSLYHDDFNPGGVAVDFKRNPSRMTLRSSNISSGTWHHVAATWDKGTGSLYVDSIEEDNDEAVFATLGVNSQDIMIGTTTDLEPSNNDYTGSMQNLSIFTVALNQTEIDELYNGATHKI